jgi:uncharacterized protein YdhG (YjbR/CyaY superfamily)
LRTAEPKVTGDPDVAAYLAHLSPAQRAVLDHLRATIAAAAPDANEVISYRMPAFRWHGRRLVYYAAFRDHFSLFPASYAVMERLADEVAPYVSGKATLRFTVQRPLPEQLVTRIVEMRLAEVRASSGGRR